MFAHYMAYWVAGVKLIFIFFVTGNTVYRYGTDKTVWGGGNDSFYQHIFLEIASYYQKVGYIKKLDKNGKITPKGYSKLLGYMISGFLCMFSLALILHFVL